MKRYLGLICVLFLLFILTGCVPGGGANSSAHPAGFLSGYWHGIIMIPTFVVSWFRSGITLYEVYNNGFWYNLGFISGTGSSLALFRKTRRVEKSE